MPRHQSRLSRRLSRSVDTPIKALPETWATARVARISREQRKAIASRTGAPCRTSVPMERLQHEKSVQRSRWYHVLVVDPCPDVPLPWLPDDAAQQEQRACRLTERAKRQRRLERKQQHHTWRTLQHAG